MQGLVMKYFVLNPLKDNAYGVASRQALISYSCAIEMENKQLAKDIREWVCAIQKELMKCKDS